MTIPRLPDMIAASASARRTSGLPAARALDQDRIVVLDRRRKNHQFGVSRIFRAMLCMKAKSEPLQAIGLERADLVGAAHVMTELEQEGRDAAHPAPRHADQMNPVTLAREELLQDRLQRRAS